MRIALAIGRPDPPFEKFSRGDVINDHTKVEFRSSTLLVSLQEACQANGWDTDVVLIGERVKQTVKTPDVFVNLICEPLVHRAALEVMARYEEQLPMPVLNHTVAVKSTARTVLADTLAGQERVVVPKTTLFDPAAGSLAAHNEDAGHSWPVLLRPLGTHGGEGLVKADDAGALPALNEPVTVTDFVDFVSSDGAYRKYRAVWAGDTLFRRHLIIGDHWNIKGESRVFMVGKSDLIQEEKNFLAGIDELDDRIAALFKTAGLDFGLIDFALTEEGDLIVFELNACFQITGSIPEDKRERWGYLEDTNQPILDRLIESMHSKGGPKP